MNYRPGHIDGKVKKAFYLGAELAKALAYKAIDTGKSQSEIVEDALRRELDIREIAAVKKVELKVVNRAEAESDWCVGYLDNRPAVGDLYGSWYSVDPDTVILNPFEGQVWYLSEKKWHSIARNKWTGIISDSDTWVDGGSDYEEGGEE